MNAIAEMSGTHSDVESQHVRKLIRMQLGRCEAATAAALAWRLGVMEEAVRHEIERMVQNDEVEAISPISAHGLDVRVHYRLRRESDHDHMWEREITIRLPLSRMAQLKRWEQESLVNEAPAYAGASL